LLVVQTRRRNPADLERGGVAVRHSALGSSMKKAA
jgi:hypothetical protein